MIIPGMVSATFRDQSPEHIIELCSQAGLKAIEWSENAHILPNDPSGAKILGEKTRSAGLKVAAYGSYYRLGEQEKERINETFKASLISAKAVDAPLIRIWGGKLPSQDVDDENRKRLAEEARMISELAKEQQIKVALEWHKNTITDTNESAEQFLKEVESDNLYCLWQPTVALNMRERCAGLEMLRKEGKLLNIHVYYWLDGVRRPLSEGLGEWKQYLSQVDPCQERFGLLEFVMGNTEEQFLEDARAWIRFLQE